VIVRSVDLFPVAWGVGEVLVGSLFVGEVDESGITGSNVGLTGS